MTTNHRRRRAAAALLAGVALAGLTLGACSRTATGTARPVATPLAPSPAASAPAAAATARPAVQHVPVPAATSRAATTRPAAPVDPNALPWGQVGLGWSAAVYSTHPSTGYGDPQGPFTVALVSPAGKRWTVGSTTSQVQLFDVSPDGTQVLARRYQGQHSQVVELDTRTHGWRDVADADAVVELQYTQPSAQQILLTERLDSLGRGSERIVRLDRSGRRTLDVVVPVAYAGAVVPTADGRLLVTGSTRDEVVVRDNATGAVVRTASSPSGYHSCAANQLWSGSRVMVWCTLDAVGRAGQSYDVLTLDAATGRWGAVTHADVDDPRGFFGYGEAWPVRSGVLAMAATGCGPGPTGLLGANGRFTTALHWPGYSDAASPEIVGVTGDTAYATYGSCGPGTDRLVAQDVVSHRTTTLLSAPWLQAVVVDGR